MVELITVVAILTILMGIAAVNVIKYQRDLKAKEADSAAKELFIAAQNHLTAADALGELESCKQAELESSPPDSFYAAVGTTSGKAGEYLITYPSGQDVALWEKMLPFGAIDETVRTGGSYVIHYSLQTATVMDVFYSDKSDTRFGVDLTLGNSEDGSYSSLVSSFATDDNKSARRNATWNSQSGRVIGWYGGTDIVTPYSDYLEQPTIKVTNGETLKVEVSRLELKAVKPSDESKPTLSLILTGVSSGALKEIKLATQSGDTKQDFYDSEDTSQIRREPESGKGGSWWCWTISPTAAAASRMSSSWPVWAAATALSFPARICSSGQSSLTTAPSPTSLRAPRCRSTACSARWASPAIRTL